MQQSVLAQYFACAGGADREEDWIDGALSDLERDIEHGRWAHATAACARFVLDIEAHFAFEELVIARTGCASEADHRRHHSEGLAVLCGLHRTMAQRIEGCDPSDLLAALDEFRLHARAHLEIHDELLWRHAGRLSGMPLALAEH